jgi:RimJ/RimL family protein N-acetyltransferase
VLSADLFRDQPVLVGERVHLEQLTEAVLEPYVEMLADPEVARLTGSHATFERSTVLDWLRSRPARHDRADWAAVRIGDGAFLGEAVLNDLDRDNASCRFRIALGAAHRGQGYGTEITRLAVGAAFAAGLHRVELGVFAFNPRARRAYEKAGFVVEGRRREALRWDGEWHDELVMAVLSTDPAPTSLWA